MDAPQPIDDSIKWLL